jgi:aconitase B
MLTYLQYVAELAVLVELPLPLDASQTQDLCELTVEVSRELNEYSSMSLKAAT